MSTKKAFVASRAVSGQTWFEHLVGGGGGSRAILAISGLVYALFKAGCDFSQLRSMGGISGGAFPTLMLANGMAPGRMVLESINVNFAGQLTKRAGLPRLMYALLMKERYERTRPRTAIFTSEKVADYLDAMVPVWPEKFWTMAVHEDKQVLFTAGGVYLVGHDGDVAQISDKPARVSDAVRGSMAVPGFIEPHPFMGMQLYDGVLSWDGLCPLGIPLRHFGARPAQVIACDVGQQDRGPVSNWLREARKSLLRRLPYSREERSPRRFAAQGALLVEPVLNEFSSLQFRLSQEQKWGAVISAFVSTAHNLHKHGKIDDARHAELLALASDRQRFRQDCEAHS